MLALRGRPVAVLVSGDPFWHGAGSAIAARLDPAEWRAFPAPSVFSLAAARLGWRTTDLMWRMAGDTATDYNHYTKRAMLLATYAATITVFLDDDSEGHAETRAFLARRIDDIMAIEKAKASATARTRYRPSLSRFVGRLRYPVA